VFLVYIETNGEVATLAQDSDVSVPAVHQLEGHVPSMNYLLSGVHVIVLDNLPVFQLVSEMGNQETLRWLIKDNLSDGK